jgi:DNA polymerase-3 subunit epsilon
MRSAALSSADPSPVQPSPARPADFLAINVATANADPASVCAIGLVHFKAGQIGRQFKFLVDPQADFDAANVALHGVRPESIAGAPSFPKIYPALAQAFATTVVVHHSYFDRFALGRAAERHRLPAPQCAWLDSAFVVRQTWPRFAARGFALKNLARAFGIELIHRDPCEDARVAGMILLRAMAENGLTLDALIERFEQQALRHTSVLRAAHVKFAQRASPWAVISAPRAAGAAKSGG